MQERGIELKVGILVLSALILLLVFIFAMGGINIEKTYTVYVDFENPGWLSSGAMVKVSGVEAGKVKSVTFMGGEYDPVAKHRVYVRLELQIKTRFQKSIHADASFYVASQGVLGEQYIEIVPGTFEEPYLEDGAIMVGVTPPKLEIVMAKGAVIIDTMHDILTENREAVDNIIVSLGGALETMDTTLKDNKTNIDEIIVNLKDTTQEARALVKGVRSKYVESPKIGRIVANVESITRKVDKDIGPILTSTRKTVDGAGVLLGEMDKQDAKGLKDTIKHIASTAKNADQTVKKVGDIVDYIEKGEGSIGALIKDEEVFDDLRELVRDLKHNPWKLFWKD